MERRIDLSPARGVEGIGDRPGEVGRSILDDPLGRPERPPWTIGPRGEVRGQPFLARIAEDGALAIEDHPLFEVDVRGPCLSCVKGDLAAWIEDPEGGRVVDLRDLLPRITPKLRVNDWLMRRGGQDPYLANKMALAKATRAERQQMAAVDRERRLREEIYRLPERLAALWARDDLPARERRGLLFELWDECAESGRGLEARATILGFLRRKSITYPEDELAALNRRRVSVEPFAP